MDVLKLIREAIEDNLTGKVFVWNDEVMDYFDNDQAALVRFLLKKNFDKIILEIKCCNSISDSHIAQAMNYLKVSNNKLAIIVNFNNDSLEYKRIVL